MEQFYFVIIPEKWEKIETDSNSPHHGKRIPSMEEFSFRTYTDRAGVFGRRGISVQYVTNRDERGREKGKFFKISQQHNAILVRDGDTDIDGKSMFDFISNHPNCEGSPNGDYVYNDVGEKVQVNALFRLLDEESDAEVALDAIQKAAKAALSVFELDETTLSEIAAVAIGMFGEPDKLMRHRVAEWARKNYNTYFNIFEAEDRFARALIRKSIADGVFHENGGLIMWKNTVVGVDENDAVRKLLSDAEMFKGLQEATNLRKELKPKKKPGPKPKK